MKVNISFSVSHHPHHTCFHTGVEAIYCQCLGKHGHRLRHQPSVRRRAQNLADGSRFPRDHHPSDLPRSVGHLPLHQPQEHCQWQHLAVRIVDRNVRHGDTGSTDDLLRSMEDQASTGQLIDLIESIDCTVFSCRPIEAFLKLVIVNISHIWRKAPILDLLVTWISCSIWPLISQEDLSISIHWDWRRDWLITWCTWDWSRDWSVTWWSSYWWREHHDTCTQY